jgi:hypothetical protein
VELQLHSIVNVSSSLLLRDKEMSPVMESELQEMQIHLSLHLIRLPRREMRRELKGREAVWCTWQVLVNHRCRALTRRAL